MSSSTLPWLLACLAVIALFAAAVVSWARQRKLQRKNLPKAWALTARPVFNADERRVYRQLREALPHHIVLSKLPLVRFCQPTDPQQVRYWYELLGTIHVAFAVCSANGRVLAAIDLETDHGGSKRAVQIKHAVLGACRVRYLRCPVDHLPSLPELQLLVPQGMTAARGPHAAGAWRASGGAGTPSSDASSPSNGSAINATNATKRRATLWQDSSFIQDSFFAPDSRLDRAASGQISSEFGTLQRADELLDSRVDSLHPPTPPLRH